MNHCSDEQLLALLDGQLVASERVGVEGHVSDCWQCRAALQVLEQDIANVVARFRAARATAEPDAAAWSRIVSACPMPREAVPRRGVWFFVAAPALGAALLALFAWRNQTAPLPDPRSAVAHAERLEGASPAGQSLALQRFVANIEESRPVARRRQIQLSVWSDLAGARSAVHWDGRIIGAAYQPDVTMADSLAGSEDIEAGLIRWLTARAPQPLSLARTLVEFADAHHLHIEWRGSWLVAERADAARRISLRLELDTGGAPMATAIRVDSEQRSWQMVLRPEGNMILSKGPARDELFAEARILPVRSSARKINSPVTPPDLEAIELEARYALHRAGLDRGQIEYVPAREELVVRAPANAEHDPEALSKALAGASHVRLELSSNAESPRDEVVIAPVQATSEPHIGEAVSRYFGRQPGTARERGERVAAWLNDLVGTSQRTMRAAWAIRRLAERYGGADLHPLRTEHRWLIEVMVRDHLDDLDEALSAQRLLLESVLGPAPTGLAIDVPDRWSEACLLVFENVRVAQETLLDLASGVSDGPDQAAEQVLASAGAWDALHTQTRLLLKRQFGTTREEP